MHRKESRKSDSKISYQHEIHINHHTNVDYNIIKFHQVSWIRRRDLAILTSNTSVYTSDTRFNVIHIPTSNNWDLRIKPVEERDSGVFSCQVNTDPKIQIDFHLHVMSKFQTIL